MSIQSVDGNNSWTHFLKLSNQARVRNAGFELPLTPQRNISSAKGKNEFHEAINRMPRAGKLYGKEDSSRYKKSTLGTSFDAYA